MRFRMDFRELAPRLSSPVLISVRPCGHDRAELPRDQRRKGESGNDLIHSLTTLI
jgi:hypothetical protein